MDILKKRSIELARMLYNQKRYKESEVILKDNLVNAESKYLMGKICLNTNRIEEAKNWFKESVFANYKWVAPRLELAKIYKNEGQYGKAEKEYWVCLKREPQNSILKIEAAKFYILQNNEEKAKILIDKAIKSNANNENVLKKALEVYDTMQDYNKMYEISEKLMLQKSVLPTEHKTIETMARTYFSLGKYEKTLKVFSINQKDSITKIIENLYKRRIYCVLSKEEKQAETYKIILDNLEAAYGEEGSIKHIQKHLKDDKTKGKHGVFTMELPKVMEEVEKAEKIKHKGNECDIYCVKIDGCGYEGGKNGDGHILNYVTLITMPDTIKPITMFPSDELKLAKDKVKDMKTDKLCRIPIQYEEEMER